MCHRKTNISLIISSSSIYQNKYLWIHFRDKDKEKEAAQNHNKWIWIALLECDLMCVRFVSATQIQNQYTARGIYFINIFRCNDLHERCINGSCDGQSINYILNSMGWPAFNILHSDKSKKWKKKRVRVKKRTKERKKPRTQKLQIHYHSNINIASQFFFLPFIDFSAFVSLADIVQCQRLERQMKWIFLRAPNHGGAVQF